MTEPDLTTEIIGFRQWYVTPDLKLRAAHKTSKEWEPGINTASCERLVENRRKDGWHPKPCKDTPGGDCECGFYALHDPSDLWYGRKSTNLWQSFALTWGDNIDPLLSGIVAAWGKVEVHHEGFRSEHARIVALALPEGKRNAAVARAVANEYGVPCVPIDDLPKIAAEFGMTIPVEMRPDKPDQTLTGLASQLWSGASSNSYHWAQSYTIIDPTSLWVPSTGYSSGGGYPAQSKPPTRNPITKREPANRQGPHAGRKRPPKDLGKGGRS